MSVAERVFSAVKRKALTPSQAADAVGSHRSTAGEYLLAMYRQGILTREPTPNVRTVYRYKAIKGARAPKRAPTKHVTQPPPEVTNVPSVGLEGATAKTRKALAKAVSRHPELALEFREELHATPRVGKRRVRRTPSGARYLGRNQ